MRAVGRPKQKHSTSLIELKEVTLSGAPTTIRQVAQFLLAAADEKEQRRRHFDHRHISEVHEDWHEKWPDIMVG